MRVNSPHVKYTDSHILSSYEYQTTDLSYNDKQELTVTPLTTKYEFKTETKVPKVGVMLVGWGGNNGSTLTASILANKQKMTWETKEGKHASDYFGSITQASTVRVGWDAKEKKEVYVPLTDFVPMASPNDFAIGGWDISSVNIADGMKRAKVLPINLQNQLYDQMKGMKPLPGIYRPDFIAANQSERADNVLPQDQTAQQHLDQIRKDIREFKSNNKCDKVIVLWTANTERFSEIKKGLNDTKENLLASIKNNEEEVSPSTIMAVASILEGSSYINGSPQNTFVPGCIDLARAHNVFIGGDDFKSGQTKMKSVLVDFLVSAGIKPTSIVSYNHLGNNDGKNLAEAKTFRSKEISKRGVVDDMIESNNILYKPNEHPAHCIVIKYVEPVGDSKRALDEYTSAIMMGGKNTIAMHNTCEDSLLATPLIIDLVVLTELMERVTYKLKDDKDYHRFDTILSVLSYLLKAPLVAKDTPLVNSLFRQKACIDNLLKALVGLPPDNSMLLEHK